MGKEYKGLNLKRENIINSISKFCNIEFDEFTADTEFEKRDNTRRRVNIEGDRKNFYMDFHFNDKGTTTIEDFGGKEVDIKKKLAYFIKNDDDCKIGDNSKNKWFVAKNIENSDFRSILELIEESEYYKETIEKKNYPDKNLYKYKGKYNEDLTIEYYKTKTVVIKGKPLLLFNEVMVTIGQLIDLDDIPKTFNDYYKVGIRKDDILTQYEIIMSNSYNKHPYKLRKVLLQAVYNSNLEGDMFEYTCLSFPALRALEGHLKYIVYNHSIKIEKNRIGSIFKCENNKFFLKPKPKAKINSQDKIKYIENAYNYYNKNRHGLCHWNDFQSPLDTTRIIENISEAKQLIIDTLSLIDSYYVL